MILFDTHAHYNDARFSEEGNRDVLLHDIFDNTPVRAIMNAGTNLVTSRESIDLAEKWQGIYAAVGVHPEDCADMTDIDGALSVLSGMLKHPKVKAIGEIGLDFYWQPYDEEHQLRWFRAQMALAEETGFPVIIHDREAHGKTMEILRAFPKVRGILHSCSCSPETVREAVKLGWFISFSGVITFKNASRILDSVRAVPDDRLLVETDCPYLAPVPYRGKMNHSGYMIETLKAAAAARGTDPDLLSALTTKNACEIYRIPSDSLT